MGLERVRHLVHKGAASYWQPTKRMRDVGFGQVKLTGTPSQIRAEADRLNDLWDRWRKGDDKAVDQATGQPILPDTVAALIRLYRGVGKEYVDASDEWNELGSETKRTYNPWLDGLTASWHDTVVKALTPKVIKTAYQATKRARGLYAGYHMMGTLRALLSFAVSEDWVADNAALKVKVKTPPKRKTKWKPEQVAAMVAKAYELKRPSIALAVTINEWLGHRPGDIWRLQWSSYDGASIQFTQHKTDGDLPRIPVSAELKERLDAELVRIKAAQVAPLDVSDRCILINEETGAPYKNSAFQHRFADIREAAELPMDLKFADFRRTVITEIIESSATDDELRSVSGHKDRNVVTRYAPPSDAMAKNAMEKRSARREKLKKEA